MWATWSVQYKDNNKRIICLYKDKNNELNQYVVIYIHEK